MATQKFLLLCQEIVCQLHLASTGPFSRISVAVWIPALVSGCMQYLLSANIVRPYYNLSTVYAFKKKKNIFGYSYLFLLRAKNKKKITVFHECHEMTHIVHLFTAVIKYFKARNLIFFLKTKQKRKGPKWEEGGKECALNKCWSFQ